MFVNLNVKSYYSLLMSSISVDDIIDFAVANKQTHVSLIDLNVLHGAPEFFRLANSKNLIPIIGIEFEFNGQKMVALAKNLNGYKVICEMSSILGKQEETKIIKSNDVIYVCQHKKINNDCFLFDDLPFEEITCLNQDDTTTVLAVRAIGTDQKLSEIKKTNISPPKWFLTEKDASLKYTKKQLENLERLLNQFENYDIFQKNKINFVKYDKKYSSSVLLQTLAREGLKKRLGSENASKKYIERLKYELDIIEKTGFNDYFLVVQDYVWFAKNNGILVGPGRGSAAGSLVSYVLGITEVDPIEHDLIFERFLNPERISMPDIDIDFMDNRRNEVVDYLFEKYGHNHVSHIVTFQRMKAKMALRDVARILEIDLAIVGTITKLFSMEYDTDIELAISESKSIASYAKKYPNLFKIVKRIVNFPRQIGVHAAGIVITNTNIWESVPVMMANDGSVVTQYSMDYLEKLGLIKMDILGLVNLTVVGNALKLIRKNFGKAVNLSKIPVNDKNVFKQLSSGETTGIFQLESPGMRNVIKQIAPTSVEDISITSALFRPGPQKNIPVYLENKKHPDKIKYLNDEFRRVLEPTYNVMVYQEQVIQIVKQVAGFSTGKADLFRRAMSKKDPIVFAKIEKDFITSGIKNGFSEEEVKQIFNYIAEFANYGFNHSHSLAYSYLSYWMAFIKYYFPLEFFTTLISSSENSVDKIITYINAAKNVSIETLPPSINHSDYSFSIFKKKIIFGFNAIVGIGHETIIKILSARNSLSNKKFSSFIECVSRLARAGLGQKVIEILILSGSFDDFTECENRAYMIQNLGEVFEKSKTMLKTGEMLIKPVLKNVKVSKSELKKFDEYQFDVLGVSFGEHPLAEIRKKYLGSEKIDRLIDLPTDSQIYHCLVIVKSHFERKDKNGNAYAIVSIEDESKIVNAVIFSSVYNNIKELIKSDEVVVVGIKQTERGYQVFSLKGLNE